MRSASSYEPIDISSIVVEYSQLASLLEQQRLADYWLQCTRLLAEKLGAQAISLYLCTPVAGLESNPLRIGFFPDDAASLLASWEERFSCQLDALEHASQTQCVTVAPELSGGCCLLQICIVVDQVVQGGYAVLLPEARLPSPAEQAALASTVHLLAGNALRAQNLLAMRQRLERANWLYKISQAVTSTLDVKQVFHQTTELAAFVLNAQAATLFSIDRDSNELVFMIPKGTAANVLEEQRIPMDRGVCGWVATHGKPLVVNHARDSEFFNPDVDSQTGFMTRNIVCVPLLSHDRTVGVLEVLNTEGQEGFTSEDAEWLTMMGQQIAIALDNAQLFAREQEKVRELAMLNTVSQTINSDLDVNAILDAVTQSALEISSADRSELFLVDYRKRALKLFSTAGYGNGARDGSYYPLDYGLPGWSITHNEPLAVRRAELDTRHVRRLDHPELDKSSVVTLPLCYRGRVVGAIAVYSLDGRAFDQEKQEVLQTFANQVAVALQNAELYQNLRSEQERIIKAQEEVRHHLARELHDNTAQMLSLITMNLDLSRRLLAEGQLEQVQAEIDEMQKLARQANREVRTLLFELRPIILESRGLIPALHAYHRQLEASMTTKIHLDAPALPLPITLQAGSAIFSVIQEAVNNIRKHARAQNIWIRVSATKEHLTFTVEDDGLGFDVATVMDQYDLSGSFGLRNMQERVQHLSGHLTFQSPRQGGQSGALVTGVIPVAVLVDAHLTSPTQ